MRSSPSCRPPDGQVRALGFSAHTRAAARELLRRFPIDTDMYPVDFIAHDTRRSDPEVLVLARRAGAAALAIKPLSAGAWRRGKTKTRHDGWYEVLGE